MNKDKIKIKHLIGTYKDHPDYPSPDDLSFEISRWYFDNGGINYIDNNTSITDLENPVFTIQNAKTATGLEEEKIQPLIDTMLQRKILGVVRKTQHNTYYRFETNDYK